jgi:hypothetical protein
MVLNHDWLMSFVDRNALLEQVALLYKKTNKIQIKFYFDIDQHYTQRLWIITYQKNRANSFPVSLECVHTLGNDHEKWMEKQKFFND